MGARVCGAAEPNQVLVTSTVKDLVAGSGLRFQDRGTYELKGIPDTWRLYSRRLVGVRRTPVARSSNRLSAGTQNAGGRT
jgi:class 3 adenylate cyclase